MSWTKTENSKRLCEHYKKKRDKKRRGLRLKLTMVFFKNPGCPFPDIAILRSPWYPHKISIVPQVTMMSLCLFLVCVFGKACLPSWEAELFPFTMYPCEALMGTTHVMRMTSWRGEERLEIVRIALGWLLLSCQCCLPFWGPFRTH